ncbi:MAG: hypothetical protein IH865_08350 [Chloroflexi bacterium]|nr:hypothetical protein [Chloroflexota bacterium]
MNRRPDPLRQEKNMEALTKTVERQKAILRARLERIRATQDEDSEPGPKRSVGRFYEVFKALGE